MSQWFSFLDGDLEKGEARWKTIRLGETQGDFMKKGELVFELGLEKVQIDKKSSQDLRMGFCCF